MEESKVNEHILLVPENSSVDGGAPPSKLPSAFVQHFFVDFKEFDDVNRAGVSVNKWGGKCKICVQSGKHKSYNKDVCGTTSNFNHHMKTCHPFKEKQYRYAASDKKKQIPPGQPTLLQVLNKSNQYKCILWKKKDGDYLCKMLIQNGFLVVENGFHAPSFLNLKRWGKSSC